MESVYVSRSTGRQTDDLPPALSPKPLHRSTAAKRGARVALRSRCAASKGDESRAWCSMSRRARGSTASSPTSRASDGDTPAAVVAASGASSSGSRARRGAGISRRRRRGMIR
jgi:hypothetical protein